MWRPAAATVSGDRPTFLVFLVPHLLEEKKNGKTTTAGQQDRRRENCPKVNLDSLDAKTLTSKLVAPEKASSDGCMRPHSCGAHISKQINVCII